MLLRNTLELEEHTLYAHRCCKTLFIRMYTLVYYLRTLIYSTLEKNESTLVI